MLLCALFGFVEVLLNMVNRIFDKKNVILLKVNEDDLNTFLVDMDIDDEGNPKYCLDDFTKAICNTIPEYVFAQYEDPNIPQNDIVEKLREAAHCIYKIKDFQLMKQWCVDKDINAYNELKRSSTAKRGEFGELLLHLILREFKHTIPLISKVYFKDSASVPAHGFDAVHVSTNEKILWLGESKLYDDSKEGIKALVKDLNEHINTDYLNDQFVIIKKNLDNNSIPGREEWIDTITNCTKLSDKLNIINIPMLCTYTLKAYELGKRSVEEYPNSVTYNSLGWVCLTPEINRKDIAVGFFEKAIELAEDEELKKDITGNYFIALLENEQFKEAEKVMCDLIEEYPCNQNFSNYAELLKRQGKLEDALEWGKKRFLL